MLAGILIMAYIIKYNADYVDKLENRIEVLENNSATLLDVNIKTGNRITELEWRLRSTRELVRRNCKQINGNIHAINNVDKGLKPWYNADEVDEQWENFVGSSWEN